MSWRQLSNWQATCQRCGTQWRLKHPTIRHRPMTTDEAFDAMNQGVCQTCGHNHVLYWATVVERVEEVAHA
jgi:rRNA maturation endonuclease Nob1